MFQASQKEPEQPQLGEDEMADLEKELELDLKNLDVNDTAVRPLLTKLYTYTCITGSPFIVINPELDV